MSLMFIGKTKNCRLHGPPELQNAINKTQMEIFIVQKKNSSIFDKEIPLTKENL